MKTRGQPPQAFQNYNIENKYYHNFKEKVYKVNDIGMEDDDDNNIQFEEIKIHGQIVKVVKDNRDPKELKKSIAGV